MEDEKKTAFCLECGKRGPYVLRARTGKCIIKGEPVEYKEVAAFCAVCNKQVWVGDVDDYNILSARKSYCEKVGLITPEQIKKIEEKYNIGARPLAELLGWGEITIIRFLNGCIPSRLYSDTLMELLTDEDAFYDLAEKNKGKIKPVAFRKIMRAKKSRQEGLGICAMSEHSEREKSISIYPDPESEMIGSIVESWPRIE